VLHARPYVERPGRDARIPLAQRRSLLELDSETCRWPVHDPAGPDFFFCGAQSAAGRPYCAAHCRRAYRTGGGRSAARKRCEAGITEEAK
jgi:GcrA cell cycle regulator